MALPSNESGSVEIPCGPSHQVPRAVHRFLSAAVTTLGGAATARSSFIEPNVNGAFPIGADHRSNKIASRPTRFAFDYGVQ
jgi:hypothetical protein